MIAVDAGVHLVVVIVVVQALRPRAQVAARGLSHLLLGQRAALAQLHLAFAAVLDLVGAARLVDGGELDQLHRVRDRRHPGQRAVHVGDLRALPLDHAPAAPVVGGQVGADRHRERVAHRHHTRLAAHRPVAVVGREPRRGPARVVEEEVVRPVIVGVVRVEARDAADHLVAVAADVEALADFELEGRRSLLDHADGAGLRRGELDLRAAEGADDGPGALVLELQRATALRALQRLGLVLRSGPTLAERKS